MGARGELAGLSSLEQEVLAALALVGDAAIAPDELAGLAGVDNVGWAVAELVDRRLVKIEDDDRVQVRSAWRTALDASDRAQSILDRALTLAETGRLSPETLLGLTGWALRADRFREALALVRAAQEALAVVRRVEEWIELLERARAAARELGDTEAVEWAEQRLEASRRLLGTSVAARSAAAPPGSAALRRVLAGAAVAAAGAAGLLVGFVAFDGPEVVGAGTPPTTAVVTERETVSETVTVPTTVTVTTPGGTTTVTETQTQTETETQTEAVVETETVITTVTVTVTAPPPPPPPILR